MNFFNINLKFSRYIIFVCASFFMANYLYAECSDLDSLECSQWAEFCVWNQETNQCEEINGGGGDIDYGPYEYLYISQSDGMRDGPYYDNATLYYPIGAETPLSNIILGPGWGGLGETMADWGRLFASYGFIAVTIDYNDPINESHEQRAIAMLDLIETVKQENVRSLSPVFDQIDTNSFAAVGYSLSGGVVQLAAVLDSTLDAVIALNSTIIIEDCIGCAEYDYCICLLPEHLSHNVPVLIISGENEINELPDYEGLLGADQYMNTPEATTKMLYEIESGGHSSAEVPVFESVRDKAINWVKYHLKDSTQLCDSLIDEPVDASQFLTTLNCPILCNEGYTEINGHCFYNNDLAILQDMINNSYESGIELNCEDWDNHCGSPNPYMDDPNSWFWKLIDGEEYYFSDGDSIIEPLELGLQEWEDGRLKSLMCGAYINCQLSGSIPENIYELTEINQLRLEFNYLSNQLSQSICDLNLNYEDNLSFDLTGNLLCPPYPICINDYLGEQDTVSCGELSVIEKTNPIMYKLHNAYPNPFNPVTTIQYDLPKNSWVTVIIYDIIGKEIKTLVNHTENSGSRSVLWNATNNYGIPVSPGIYFYQIQTEGYTETKKMLLLK